MIGCAPAYFLSIYSMILAPSDFGRVLWKDVVGFFHPLTLGRKQVGGVLRWFLCWFPLCVAVAAAFAAVDVATAAVVVAFAFADVAVVAVVAFAFADVAAVAVLALLLLEEVRFVRTENVGYDSKNFFEKDNDEQ